MATNQMRREAAKRKLKSQQERRETQAKRRQRTAVITSVAVVVAVVGAVIAFTALSSGAATDPAATDPAAAPSDSAPTDAAAPGACAFTPTPAEPAAKPAPVPTTTEAPTTGTAAVTLETDRGAIPLTLDRSTGPCAVENFLSLTAAGYYDATPCHRLTASAGLSVLQCGDPTGTGSGGPGYTINDEPPTGLAPDPGGNGVVYPRGTVAMAKTAAPDSGGSQFFLVYADSTLPPDYTVFGTIGEEGLAVLDAIGAAGTADGGQDGAPAQPVTILTATAA